MADKQNEQSREVKSIGELTYKLSLDISDALIGLKALQREAKEATKAIKELEQVTVAPLKVDEGISPLTVTDVPNHVKNYGGGTTYTSTGNKSTAWFKDK